MGRPIKAEPRCKQLNLSLTEAELASIRQRAEAVGMRAVHFGRALLLDETISPGVVAAADNNMQRMIHSQLVRLGNNLNQLVRHCHITGEPLPDDLVDFITFGKKFGKPSALIEHQLNISRLIALGPQTEFISKDRKKISDYLQEARGFYHLFRAPENARSVSQISRGGIILVGAVPVSDRKREKNLAILARLSIPSIDATTPFLYTGVICFTQVLTTWNFLQDDASRRDFVVLMTNRANPSRRDRQQEGHLVTMDQSQSNPASASYVSVIRKCHSEMMPMPETFLQEAASLTPDNLDDELIQMLGIKSQFRKRS